MLFPASKSSTAVSRIRDLGFLGWWFIVIGSVFVHSRNDKQILCEKMSDAKNLCENVKIVWIKTTEKRHVHHVPAAILGETPQSSDPAHFILILCMC